MVAFRLPVLSSLRGPQPAALHVLPAFEFGDIQNKGYTCIGKGSYGLEYKANHKINNW